MHFHEPDIQAEVPQRRLNRPIARGRRQRRGLPIQANDPRQDVRQHRASQQDAFLAWPYHRGFDHQPGFRCRAALDQTQQAGITAGHGIRRQNNMGEAVQIAPPA